MMGGPVRWFIHNPIAANLLMVFLLVSGLLGIPALDKQFFPEFEINQVSVTLAYPGAGPREGARPAIGPNAPWCVPPRNAFARSC